MSNPPGCTALGRHCYALSVTLRVAELDGGPSSGDHEATWLRGHTEHIRFGRLERRGSHLYCRATLHVPCRHLAPGPGHRASCKAHGFRGPLAPPIHRPASMQLGDGRFRYVQRGRECLQPLRPAAVARSLPVRQEPNPCATARCRTANHAVGAACCRDLQLEVLCSPRSRRLEALLRSRRSPLLCKVDRESPDSLGMEVISACSYLASDGVSCSLHGLLRRDGRQAKPDLCFEWPAPGSTLHPGCVLGSRR